MDQIGTTLRCAAGPPVKRPSSVGRVDVTGDERRVAVGLMKICR